VIIHFNSSAINDPVYVVEGFSTLVEWNSTMMNTLLQNKTTVTVVTSKAAKKKTCDFSTLNGGS